MPLFGFHIFELCYYFYYVRSQQMFRLWKCTPIQGYCSAWWAFNGVSAANLILNYSDVFESPLPPVRLRPTIADSVMRSPAAWPTHANARQPTLVASTYRTRIAILAALVLYVYGTVMLLYLSLTTAILALYIYVMFLVLYSLLFRFLNPGRRTNQSETWPSSLPLSTATS